jgi:hypothetical protein
MALAGSTEIDADKAVLSTTTKSIRSFEKWDVMLLAQSIRRSPRGWGCDARIFYNSKG